MTEVFWLVFELGINLLQGVFFAYFLCGCLEYKRFKKTKFIPCILCAVLVFGAISICNRLVFNEGFAVFIYSLITFICSVIFFKGTVTKKMFVSIVPVNAAAVGSIFSTNFIAYLVNKPIYEFMPQSTFLRISAIVLSNIVFFSIIFLIRRITMKKSLTLNNAEWLLLTFNLFLSSAAYVLILHIIYDSQSIIINLYSALSAVVIVVINITMYILLARFAQRNVIETEYKLLKQHAEMQAEAICETKAQYNELRKTKHDFTNTLAIIRNLGETKGVEEICNYIDEYLQSQSHSVRMVETGNAYIDAVINTKIAQAEEGNVLVTVSTITNFKTELNVELCNILGNMFDNAITASKDSKDKLIYLEIFREHDSLVIRMKNSIDEAVLKNNPNLLTSKADKEKHGFGTRIIKDTAKRIGGFADFYEEDSFFVCNVVLYI